MKFTAIIELSAFNECPDRALQSVRDCAEYIAEVQIVAPHLNLNEKAEFDTGSVPCRVVARVDYQDAQALLYIPPYTLLTSAKLFDLRKQMHESKLQQVRFAVTSSTNCATVTSFWNIFHILITVWWRVQNWWENNKLYRHTDVRACFIGQKGNFKTLPPMGSWWWRLWNPICARAISDGEGAINTPDDECSGWDYLHWTLHRHRSFGWGVWILYYALLLYITLSALNHYVRFVWLYAIGDPNYWMQGPMYIFFSVLYISILLPLCSALMASRYTQINRWWLYYMLQPIAIILFVPIVFYARFVTPKKTWK